MQLRISCRHGFIMNLRFIDKLIKKEQENNINMKSDYSQILGLKTQALINKEPIIIHTFINIPK